MAIDVLIADRDPLVRRVLRLLLELSGDIHVVRDLASAEGVVQASRVDRPAVVLVDQDLLERAGYSLPELGQQLPGVAILALALYPGLAAPGVPRIEVLPKDCPHDDLIATVRRLAAQREPPDAGRPAG